MTMEIDRLARKFEEMGFHQVASILDANAEIARISGVPEEFTDPASVSVPTSVEKPTPKSPEDPVESEQLVPLMLSPKEAENARRFFLGGTGLPGSWKRTAKDDRDAEAARRDD